MKEPKKIPPAELRTYMERVWRQGGCQNYHRPARWITRWDHWKRNIGGYMLFREDEYG